jgi:hypothetical protein
MKYDRQPSYGTHSLARAMLVLATAVLSLGLQGCDLLPGCTVDGERIGVGVTFQNDCNTCRCDRGGSLSCTAIGCIPANECNGTLCKDREFCRQPACGNVGSGCAPRPLSCDDLDAPVCGCDLKTYRNECVPFAMGISVLHEGECRHDSFDAGPSSGDASVPSL